jgi:hypothetical protein
VAANDDLLFFPSSIGVQPLNFHLLPLLLFLHGIDCCFTSLHTLHKKNNLKKVKNFSRLNIDCRVVQICGTIVAQKPSYDSLYRTARKWQTSRKGGTQSCWPKSFAVGKTW